MKRMLAVLWLLPVFLATLGITGCATNPATGKKSFIAIPESQEIALGVEAAPKFQQDYGGDIPSAAIQQYVNDLGHRLAAVSESPQYQWEFHAVDSSVLNAFCLPGGKVFITRELLSQLTNEAQLAGVLGHECGHAVARHVAQQMSQQMALQVGVAAIGVGAAATNNDYLAALGYGAGQGGSLYLLHFSRSEESEADMLGVRYMEKLGYNPVGQIQVMEILKKASGGGGGGINEWLQTHPAPDTRIKDLNKLIPQKYPKYNADPPFYKFNEQQYQSTVLAALKTLPPPRHDPEHKYSKTKPAAKPK